MNIDKEIMLIDDDLATNYLSKIIINKTCKNTNLNSFYEADKALDELVNRISHQKKLPDIILLDLNMPRIDGWEFLDIYSKLDINHNDIHLYILTTSINPKDLEKSKSYDNVIHLYEKPLTANIVNLIFENLPKHS